VPLAEQFRRNALHLFGRANDSAVSFALSGHHKPDDVQREHQHAFYLPLGTGPTHPDFLNELHVWCPYGFTQAEVEALMCVDRLDLGSGKYPVRPVLVSIGNAAPKECPISTGQTSGRIWRSRTPFVPPRYFYRGKLHGAKLKASDAPEQQLLQCLQRAGIDTPGEVRRLTLNGTAQQSLPPLADWDIVRTPEGEDGSLTDSVVIAVHVPTSAAKTEKIHRVGLFFEVTFDASVTFHIPALGHSSHFGLGLFVPASDD
jgi:CRISPR-associated protein Csb2